MIADAHCHAWRYWPYDDRVPDRERRGSAEALLYEMDAHGVEVAAVVCARIGAGASANEDNNDYVTAAAAEHPDRLIVVPDVDGTWRPEHHTPGAAGRLRETVERAGAVAFTHYVGATNDGWFRRDDGREFWQTAADLRLVASLAASPAWYDDVAAVARAHPELPILLHHLGGIDATAGDGELRDLLRLADVPNVSVKISGFHYLGGPSWAFPYDEARAAVGAVYARFGARRLCWGSDFPAARRHQTYRQSLEVVRRLCGLAEADLPAVMGQNLLDILRTRRPLPSEAPPTPTPSERQ